MPTGIPMLPQAVVHALPTGTVHEPTVDEHDRDGRGCRSTHNALLSVPLTASRLGRRVIRGVVCGWLLIAGTAFFWALRVTSHSSAAVRRTVPARRPDRAPDPRAPRVVNARVAREVDAGSCAQSGVRHQLPASWSAKRTAAFGSAFRALGASPFGANL